MSKQPLRTVPHGVMHVPVTPFKADNSVDYATFEKLVDWHVRQKPSSLCVILHIAESVSLTIEEHKKLIEISVKVTNGRVPVIANVSSAGTDIAVDLARHSEKVGADATICLAPYYWPVPEEALHDHFYRVAKAPLFDTAAHFDFKDAAAFAKLRPLMASVNAPGAAERDALAYLAGGLLAKLLWQTR